MGARGTLTGGSGEWRELRDEELLVPPGEVTLTPVDPQLELLPTDEMSWPSFENLLTRVAREVQGLRSVLLYGTSGQSQHGIDLVGINPEGENEAVQGKRYQSFTVADLDKAVSKYLDGTLPFTIRRLAIGVSCTASEKKVVNRLIELNAHHPGVEFDLWDRRRLSELLRSRPDIVREFFGDMTALRFCGRFKTSPQPVPPLEAVALADAVMRGPAEASGAQKELDAANRCRATNPGEAVGHLRRAQRILKDAGFAGHARVIDAVIVECLIEAGSTKEAVLLLADSAWSALDEDRTSDAEHLSRRLGTVARQGDDPVAQSLPAVIEAAVASCQHPLGYPPDLSILSRHVPPEHQARLLLLAGESELARGRVPFSEEDSVLARTLLAETPDLGEAVAIRIKLCLAESGGGWAGLLRQARTRTTIPRRLSALVLARHARFLANHADPDAADAAWSEAVEQGCLAKIHSDAANWLYSQSMLASRYRPNLDGDPYHPLVSALNAEPGQPPVTGASESARERALADLRDQKLRPAAIRLQRYLRDSAASASWAGEQEARRMLADVLKESGEPDLAARHMILAGAADPAYDLGRGTEQYLDMAGYLDAPSYWVKASALRLIAAQADLVPDDQVQGITEQAFTVLDHLQTGELRDTPIFSPSVYLAAHEALAALSERLTISQAARLLDILEPLTAVGQPSQYRHTDKSHAIACTGIGHAHSELADRAVDQLLGLLERASYNVPADGQQLISQHLGYSRPQLERQRDAGVAAAAELLAQADPESVSLSSAEDAATALTGPTLSKSGIYSMGTGAVYQSMLARQLPAGQRAEIIRAQIERCRSPYEAALNRREYLIAAANLADDLPEAESDELFNAAIALIRETAESEIDRDDRTMSHPLGAMRIKNNIGDERPAAALLAARLARTQGQKAAARDTTLRLLGLTDDGDYWCTQALRILIDELQPEIIPILTSLGWPLRSLAAIVWASANSSDSDLGTTLAQDPDQRVRRALAQSLATVPASARTAPVRAQLAVDPRYSVRKALHKAEGGSAPDYRQPGGPA